MSVQRQRVDDVMKLSKKERELRNAPFLYTSQTYGTVITVKQYRVDISASRTNKTTYMHEHAH